jgi:hypothetical protein
LGFEINVMHVQGWRGKGKFLWYTAHMCDALETGKTHIFQYTSEHAIVRGQIRPELWNAILVDTKKI